MAQTYCDQVEYMTDYFPQVNFYMFQGPAPRIRARNIPDDFYSCKYEDTHIREKKKVKLRVNNPSPLFRRCRDY